MSPHTLGTTNAKTNILICVMKWRPYRRRPLLEQIGMHTHKLAACPTENLIDYKRGCRSNADVPHTLGSTIAKKYFDMCHEMAPVRRRPLLKQIGNHTHKLAACPTENLLDYNRGSRSNADVPHTLGSTHLNMRVAPSKQHRKEK